MGGLDPLVPADLTGQEPDDGYPVLLSDWIDRDGLTCIKIKLMGVDAAWDLDRILRVGRMARAQGVRAFTADFNCSVHDPQYVAGVLDALATQDPDLYAQLLYVEQPFPYDLEKHQLDVHAVSAQAVVHG